MTSLSCCCCKSSGPSDFRESAVSESHASGYGSVEESQDSQKWSPHLPSTWSCRSAHNLLPVCGNPIRLPLRPQLVQIDFTSLAGVRLNQDLQCMWSPSVVILNVRGWPYIEVIFYTEYVAWINDVHFMNPMFSVYNASVWGRTNPRIRVINAPLVSNFFFFFTIEAYYNNSCLATKKSDWLLKWCHLAVPVCVLHCYEHSTSWPEGDLPKWCCALIISIPSHQSQASL